MKKFLIIIFMSLIASTSFYGITNKEKKQQKNFQNTVEETIQKNVIQNEISVEKQEDTVDAEGNIVEQQENVVKKQVKQGNTKQNEKREDTNINKKSEIQEIKQKNNEQNQSSSTNSKKTEQNNKSNTQTTTSSKQNQSTNTKKVDLSKYFYYEKASDGSYKAFLVDKTEINNLKALIDNVIKSFGYKNVKVTVDSSLSRDGTMYFTANKTNVENLVYDSEGFNIYYYAVKEYHISPNGTENYFQTRSYIKVK